MSLSNSLSRELVASGLPPDVHYRLGYRVVTADECQALMGYRLSGWVVPMNDREGKPFLHDGKPFFRLKPDPDQLKGEKPPKYLSPKEGGCRPYFSPLMPKGALAKGKLLRITEGEKKADCLNHHGFATIGLSGVDAWTDKRVEHQELIPELADIDWSGRQVLLVFDSDVTVKDTVREALHRLVRRLSDEGASVLVVHLPCELNGDKNGADDFICRHGADAYRAIEDIARPAITWKNQNTPVMWSPEPTEPHYKALTAWTIFDGTYAIRPNHGLYRFNDSHWIAVEGKYKDAVRRPIHLWMDHMGWRRRGNSVIDSIVSEVLDRLQVDQWDGAGLMAFANGTVRNGAFTAGHDRNDHLTFCFPFAYDAGAKCKLWKKFIQQTLGADDLIRLLRAAIRWSLVPKPTDKPFRHELVFDVHGPKRAGKGTLSEVLQAICGGDAGVGLIRSHSFGNANALHDLIGKRIAVDPDASGRIPDPGVFNSISSNEKVEVKKLYKDIGCARLGVVIWRFFNDTPGASGGGIEGMGRRIVTFRFEKTVANPDEELKRKLIAEAAGIFWWAWSMPENEMNDALRNRGLVAAIREASIEGALERDHVLRFSTIATEDTHRAADLYKLYSEWMKGEGHHPVSATKFGLELKKLPWVKPTRDQHGTHYQTHHPTHQELATHIGIALDVPGAGEFNSPPDQTHQQNPPQSNALLQQGSQESMVSVVGCSLKKREREEEEEKSKKMPMGSEVGHKPTTPTTGVPVYVDGESVSLTPLPAPKPEQQLNQVGPVRSWPPVVKPPPVEMAAQLDRLLKEQPNAAPATLAIQLDKEGCGWPLGRDVKRWIEVGAAGAVA